MNFEARFKPETLKILEQIAEIDESSVAQVIRTACTQYIRKRKKSY